MKNWEMKEKSDAKLFNGTRTPGSGNHWGNVGDIRTKDFLVESKFTQNKSFSLTKKLWEKISDEALFTYKLPMMSIRIQDLDLVVMGREDWIKILDKQ